MRTFKQEFWFFIKFFVIAVVFMIVIRSFVLSPYEVRGESMSPNLQSENKLIVSKFTELIPYKRFDIIVFESPDSDARYVKRVIGLPGDSVKMVDDVLYVNDKKYDESYLKEARDSQHFLYTGDFSLKELTGHDYVPKGQLFVLGDNRSISKDSRYFGLISEKKVIGKAIMSYWPLKRIGKSGTE